MPRLPLLKLAFSHFTQVPSHLKMSLTSVKIRIGTRASNLAMAQSLEVKNLILANNQISEQQIEIITFTTSGDKIQDRNLADIGGKGLFIKELEEALVQNRIDIAIHSAKDVPPFLHEDTEIAAFTKRLDARDCLISKKYNSIEDLPKGAVIGTSSARRKSILLRLRPDFQIINFRGNIDTRLNKINSDEVDASILALCGLQRTSREIAIKEIIPVEIMLPSGGQGSLAIQIRKDNSNITKIVQQVNDLESQICLESERAFLKELGASCATPVAVYAWLENNQLNFKTMILDYDGSAVFETLQTGNFDLKSGLEIAIKAAIRTKTEAAELLKKICN